MMSGCDNLHDFVVVVGDDEEAQLNNPSVSEMNAVSESSVSHGGSANEPCEPVKETSLSGFEPFKPLFDCFPPALTAANFRKIRGEFVEFAQKVVAELMANCGEAKIPISRHEYDILSASVIGVLRLRGFRVWKVESQEELSLCISTETEASTEDSE
jgi:hypothetical protein